MIVAEIASLMDQYQKNSRYSLEDLKKEGQPGFPTVDELLSPNIVIDPNVVENEFLNTGIPPKASEPVFVRQYLDAMLRKRDELLTSSGSRPFELRIDALSEQAKIEYEEGTYIWSLTIDAESIFNLIHRSARGVDPNPPLTTSTPIRWEYSVKPVTLSLKDTYAFQHYLHLKKQIQSLEAEIRVVHAWGYENILYFLKNGLPEDRPADEDSRDKMQRSLQLCKSILEAVSLLDSCDLQTDISIYFLPARERKKSIIEGMLKIASPALEAGSALMEKMISLYNEIEWSFFDDEPFPDDTAPQGGGSIMA